MAQPIFTQIYPHCYGAKVPNPHGDCSAELVDSQTYTQVLPMQPFASPCRTFEAHFLINLLIWRWSVR